MIYPNNLKIGDNVGLIATSGFVNQEKLNLSISKIKNMKLNPILGKTCRQKFGYFSADDNTRAQDVNMMFSDKKIKAIFVLRGGYGAQRIINKLDFDLISKNPKIFTGYSDITVLHNVINQKCNLVTYHAPMFCVELYKDNIDEITTNSFLDNMFLDRKEYYIDNSKNKDIKVLVKGNFKGVLTGGNLSVITSSLGTNYEIDTYNKVLFLEDVNEPPYKIDQKLTQLKNANKFNNVKGIILGHFTNCFNANDKNSFTLEEILKDIILPLNIPCLYNFCCGHELPNITLPFGRIIEVFDNKIKIM